MFNKRFGIELEIVGLSAMQAAAIIRNAGFSCQYEGYNHTDHADAWKVVTDSSISGTGCEVVSPILCGESGLTDARKVADSLEAAGATANRSCGFHVHFDASQMSVEDVRAIFARYARFEAEIDAFMPNSRRADNNMYCRSIMRIAERVCTEQTLHGMAIAQPNRYYKLNLQSYLRHHTIEFRQHSGTCSATKIANWVLFLNDFIDAALMPSVAELPAVSAHLAKTWRFVCANPGQPSKIYAEQAGVTPGRMRAHLAALRLAGYPIQQRNGAYHIVETAIATDNDSVFCGVRESVKAFYEARKIQLAA